MPLNARAVAAVAVDGVLPARWWRCTNVTPAKIAAATSSKTVTASDAINVGRETRAVLVTHVGAGAGGWVEHYRRFWEDSFSRLEEYLTELQTKPEEKKRGRKK